MRKVIQYAGIHDLLLSNGTSFDAPAFLVRVDEVKL